MKPTHIPFTDEATWLSLRLEDITSTDVSALFGLSPYSTEFELYHRKKSKQTVEFEENTRMTWGKRLQDSIAKGVAEDHGWKVRPLTDYVRHKSVTGMGSSFDWEIFDHKKGPGILEIKVVDYVQWKKGWIDDADDSEAPNHIEIQLQHQLEDIDYNWGVIAALVGGNTPIVLIRERDRELGKIICNKVSQFWKDIENGHEPTPDYTKDADFIRKIYQNVSGDPIDLSANNRAMELCYEYRRATEEEKGIKEKKDAARSELLTMIGASPAAKIGKYKISANTVNKKEYTVSATSYRDFRMTEKKD